MSIEQLGANLAAAGVIGGQPAQPGQRGPLGVLPGLAYQNPLSGAAPKGSQPLPPSPLAAALMNAGKMKGGQPGWVEKLAASLREDFGKCGAEGAVRQASIPDITGQSGGNYLG